MRLQDKIGLDKCCHFFAGAAVAYVALHLATPYTPYGLWFGLYVAVIAGMVKEAVDKARDESVDWMDITATSLGGLVPLIVQLLTMIWR